MLKSWNWEKRLIQDNVTIDVENQRGNNEFINEVTKSKSKKLSDVGNGIRRPKSLMKPALKGRNWISLVGPHYETFVENIKAYAERYPIRISSASI
ncbi:hypothetical protein WA026_009311 [Henosepilachna vigintioctopunctata]|uniref:Uncharacterized protein n=1 Tax=Henosepilachna vigintioctopunctata TaxID=420089 RepID=A0AAW1UNK9_9CUCU